MKGIKILCMAMAVIFVIGANLSAQGGLKTSFNLSKCTLLKPSTLGDDHWLAGFQIGVYFDLLKITPYIELRPEVMYIRKGTKLLEGSTDITNSIKEDYIEVPVMLKFNVFPKNNVNPYFVAGAYWAYLTRAKNDIDIGDDHDQTIDIKDDLKTSDFGLIGGVGVDFKLGKMPKTLSLEARYELGLIDIVLDDDVRIKNSSFVFNVGLGF